MSIISEIKKVIKEIDKHSPYPVFYSFEMSQNEKKLFDRVIRNSKYYLEFGMGGSTIRVLGKTKSIIYSVDSSIDWVRLMREYWMIRYMEKKRLNLFHIDIGKTGKWGKPKKDISIERFPNYSVAIFNFIEKRSVDTILIDGRFRVACTLKSILECSANLNLKILIHDFHRENYHVVLKYLNVIELVETLGVFKMKNDIDLNSVEQEYELYKFDPS